MAENHPGIEQAGEPMVAHAQMVDPDTRCMAIASPEPYRRTTDTVRRFAYRCSCP
jgi:hypothetical protein